MVYLPTLSTNCIKLISISAATRSDAQLAEYCVGAISSEAFSQLQRSRACVINRETLNRDLKQRIRKSQYVATTDIESSSNIAAWLMRRDFS